MSDERTKTVTIPEGQPCPECGARGAHFCTGKPSIGTTGWAGTMAITPDMEMDPIYLEPSRERVFPPDPQIEEVVVTASPVPRKRSNLTSSVSVIGEGEIDLQKYDNVSELLRHVPCVHIEQPGSRG